jgi:hypothetical protein
MKTFQTAEDKVLAKLGRIVTLLEDLFILEASHMGMNKEPLREILRIDKRRIGRIAKHVEAEQERQSGSD